jgi:hypothetical protein
MRKYITIILMCFAIFGKAQIGQKVETKKSTIVGKVAPLGAFKEELSYVESENGLLYTLSYNDLKFIAITDIKSISFYATANDVESLYNDMKGQFDKEVGQSYDFKLGEADVRVERSKYLGVPILTIYVIKNGVQSFFYLTKKETDKLFGK